MVLRRQYRHLREELAKLKVPEGLNDLDAPFNPNVTLPAMSESSNNSGTISVAKSNGDSTIVHTTVSVSTSSGNNESTQSIITESSDPHETAIQSMTSAPLTPLEINTNQPFISCTIDDDSDSPAILPQATLPTTVTAKIVSADEPLMTNDVDGDDDEGDDVIATEGDELDYKFNTVDELMEQLFFDNSENAMHYDD